MLIKKTFLFLSVFLSLVSFADPIINSDTNFMTAEEQAFVQNLNKVRIKNGELPIEYSAHTSDSNQRYLFPLKFQEDLNSKFATTSHLFYKKIYELTKGNPVVLELFAGFSAAEYDKELLKNDLKSYVKMTTAENKTKYGPNTFTIFVGGATAEGIGMIYSPDIQAENLIKLGIGSDQVLPYEVKYGNQLGKDQDVIFLVDSFKDANGKKVWEVKTSEDAKSYNNTIFDSINSEESKFNLFEGGDIGFKEALEWLEERSSASYRNRKFTLNLILGYQATNHAKDKGFRVSTQMAQLLMRFPELIPNNVSINIFESGNIESGFLNLQEFKKTKLAKRILEKQSDRFNNYVQQEKVRIASEQSKYPQWYKSNQAQLEAKIRILESWSKIDPLALSVLKQTQERNKKSLEYWIRIMNTPSNKLPLDLKEDKESGVAQESINFLKIKIQNVSEVINHLNSVVYGASFSCLKSYLK